MYNENDILCQKVEKQCIMVQDQNPLCEKNGDIRGDFPSSHCEQTEAGCSDKLTMESV